MDAEARPRANLAAVAARAGVSRSTASVAFSGAGPVSEATRQRVLSAAAELGYAGPDPRARSLRQGRSGIIGVVIEDRLRDAFRDPINIAMLDGLADEVGPMGASVLLITETSESSGSVETAPVDAVVLLGCSTRLDQRIDVVRQRGIPVVAIEAEHRDGVVAVDLDNREASRTIAQHLSDLGHTHVAVVTLDLDASHARGPLTDAAIAASTSFVALQRVAGVRDVFPDIRGWVAAGSLIEEGTTAGLALLADPATRPTAIVAQSDLLAVGVIRAAEQLGLQVPQDVSVAGFDGIRIDGIAPLVLTTMAQPAVEKGRAAGRAVLSLLAGEEAPTAIFTAEFVRGSTTARPADF